MASAVTNVSAHYELWDAYRAERDEWANNAANDEDFYMGNQWTKDELSGLKKNGMAPIVVNRVMPVIQQEMSIFLSKRPTFRYLPQADDDVERAKIYSDAASHVWNVSNGDSQLARSAQDYFVTGAGYLLAYVDGFADEGRGEVKFKHVPWADVYPDPNSREPDLSDARYIFISRLIDKETLKFFYPDKEGLIGGLDEENGPVTDRPISNPQLTQTRSGEIQFASPGKKGKVRVIESYRKIRKKRLKLFDTRTGESRIVEPKFFDASMAPATIRTMEFWDIAVLVTVTAGKGTKMDEYEMAIDRYPLVPMYLHHNGNPFPKGDVAVIKGMQQEINKRRSIMIHNASLAGNSKWLAEKGSIPDKEEFEKNGARPGKVLEYRRSSQGDAPREVMPQQLPSAWIQLEESAKGDLEYAVSVFAHMMGSSQDAPETYRGLLALEEAGGRKQRQKAIHARHALRNLGIVIQQLIQQTYTGPKMIRLVGEDSGEIRKVFLNEPRFDPLTGRVQRFNDVTVGTYDLIVEDGTSMPSNRMALLQLYLEMYQLGIIDKTEVLKKTDISNIDEVTERMGEIAQLVSQVENLKETLKQEQGLNQTLRRALQQSQVQIGAAKEMSKVQDSMRGTVMQNALAQARIKDEVGMTRERLKLAEQKGEMTIAAAITQAKLDAAAMKADAKLEAKRNARADSE